MLRFPGFLILVFVCAQSGLAWNAFTLRLGPYVQECFFDKLKPQDRLDIAFEVTSGEGNNEIDFWIDDASRRILHSVHGQTSHNFGFNAEREGTYTFCFSNTRNPHMEKTLVFTMHGPDERYKLESKIDSIDGDDHWKVEGELRALAEEISSLRDESTYLIQREAQHRKTAESTKRRVLWWSLIESFLLIGVSVFQVWYFRRFFEVKRLV
ncbi:emp24/gp25L/p24 family/GOLD-domain-containing protein [Cladochytrium replicatum]|nr:emp24/gp25L/p24 family/GOLD-domain-containing protein [Cladochytrium replicatum]